MSTIKPQRLNVSGVDVAYRRSGDGESLLYLHGMGLTRRWLPLYELLAGEFDVLVPEHPGFGDTPRPRWFRGLDDIAIHHATFLDRLGVGPVHLLGHSLGGLIAASLASLFPERVRTLSLVAPAPLPVVSEMPTPPDDLPDDFDIDELLFNGDQASYPDFRHGDDDGLALADGDGDAHADPEAFDMGGSPSLYRRLARIDAPVQLVLPDEDLLIPESVFDEWARWLPTPTITRVRGDRYPTGHLLIVQEPRRLADALAAFCRPTSE